jgi:hypothetical protein
LKSKNIVGLQLLDQLGIQLYNQNGYFLILQDLDERVTKAPIADDHHMITERSRDRILLRLMAI